MKKTLRRTGAALLSAALGAQLFCGIPAAAAEPAASAAGLSPAASVVTDLSAYTKPQVLVMYTDKTTKLLTYASKDALAKGLATLQDDPHVLVAQPNYSYASTALSVNDEYVGKQWALYNDGTFSLQDSSNDFPVDTNPFGGRWNSNPGGWFGPFSTARAASSSSVQAVKGIDLNIQTAWDTYKSASRQTVVALIDTGVDYTNSELSGSIWTNPNEIAGNGKDDDGDGYIDDVHGWNFYNGSNRVYVGEEDDHGTHCAGSMVAASNDQTGTAGIVPGGKVKIMVLKALGGSDGTGTTASIITAIKYAEAHGASIVNLSLGSSENDQALYQAIASSKMLFVIAAGNGTDTSSNGVNIDSTPIYPAAYNLDNIITVANLNCNGKLHYSSNYGKTSVDLAAPGTYILSTTTGGTYSYMTGTSMAAPMVTASAAMIYSYYKAITLPQTKALILQTVHTLSSLKGVVSTGGMLDLGAAMTYPISKLPKVSWKTAASASAASAGSAPVITTNLVTEDWQQYLKLTVTDKDGDLSRVRYASGTRSASYFSSGGGTAVTLDSSGSAVFSVWNSGSYTFYAVDKKGHSTVKTISLTFSYGTYSVH